MKKITAFFLTGLLMVGLKNVNAVEYTETFESGKNPQDVFFGHLLLGEEETWGGRLENNTYVLANPSDEGSIRYYYIMKLPAQSNGDLTNATVSVDVGGTFETEVSGSGLIFRFDPQRKFYFALLVKKDGSYSFIKRDEGGFNEVMGGSIAKAGKGGMNRLMMQGEGKNVALYVNREKIGGFENENFQSGGVGIIAVGTGKYIFDNLAISTPE